MKKFLKNTFIAVFCTLCFDLFESTVSFIIMNTNFIDSSAFIWVYIAQYFILIISAFVVGKELLVKTETTKTLFVSVTVAPVVIFAALLLLGLFVAQLLFMAFIFPTYLLLNYFIMFFDESPTIISVFTMLQHLIYFLAMFFGTCRKGNEQTDKEKIMG